ncbi:MAG: hypothetical protein ACTSP4_00825 [Candidatus Hodarchaeales archaeon]
MLNLRKYVIDNILEYAIENDYTINESTTGDCYSKEIDQEIEPSEFKDCVNSMFQDMGYHDFQEMFEDDTDRANALSDYLTEDRIRNETDFIQYCVDGFYWDMK